MKIHHCLVTWLTVAPAVWNNSNNIIMSLWLYAENKADCSPSKRPRCWGNSYSLFMCNNEFLVLNIHSNSYPTFKTLYTVHFQSCLHYLVAKHDPNPSLISVMVHFSWFNSELVLFKKSHPVGPVTQLVWKSRRPHCSSLVSSIRG